MVAEQATLIGTLRAEVAALRRQVGRDSSNSSQPPSQDGPAAKARASQAGETRRARAGRPQGGQKGHPGASLAWTARPDETLAVEPGTCGGCGADLAAAAGRVASSVQVADIPPAALAVTEYRMMQPYLRVRAGHDSPAAAGSDRRPGVLRAERDRRGDVAGQHGRDRGRAGRGPDGRPAQGTGLYGICLPLPGPSRRSVNHRRVRGRAQGRPEIGGRARHRRDSRPAGHCGHQRGRLRQPARLHRADHGGLHRRRGGPDLVRRGRATGRSWRSPASGSWTATAGSWSATTTAATSATTPGSPECSSAWLTYTATSTTPTPPARHPRSGPGRPAMPSARPRPQSGPPAAPARPAWTPPSWPGCATATTRPSPSGSR